MKILISLFLLSIVSFANAQSMDQEIESIGNQLKAVEGIIDRIPYKEQQHTTIESYFKGMNDLALNIKDYSNTYKSFNNYIRKYGAETFCKKTFLDSKRWKDLVTNCSVNGFFLCAEEVRGFSEIKKSLKDSLRDDLKKNFEESKFCNVP
jgi:hypothetical protein